VDGIRKNEGGKNGKKKTDAVQGLLAFFLILIPNA